MKMRVVCCWVAGSAGAGVVGTRALTRVASSLNRTSSRLRHSIRLRNYMMTHLVDFVLLLAPQPALNFLP